jgi:hypothetical protein
MSTYVFTQDDIATLKHLTGINRSMIFRAENDYLIVVDPASKKMAKAVFPKPPVTFGVYNLPGFLSTVVALEAEEIDLDGNTITVNGKNRNTAKIAFSPEELILCCPTKLPRRADVVTTVLISNETISDLHSVGKNLGATEIKFYSDSGILFAMAYNPNEPKGNHYKVELGETDAEVAGARVLLEYMNLLDGMYELELNMSKIIKLTSEKMTYWIAEETDKAR